MEGRISARGQSFVAQKPAFFDVLSDSYDPISNPDGIVNIGLAENVSNKCIGWINAKHNSDPHARGNGSIYQLECKIAPGPLYDPARASLLNWALQMKIKAHALTYGDGYSGSHRLKEALCHFLNSQFRPWTALYPSNLVITSGVSNAVECCAWALADPGDYFLVGRPYYNAFKTALGTRPG